MTEASNDQNDAMAMVKYPPGWNNGNPDHIASPFAYYSSYTNPAYHAPQSGGGSVEPASNMFSSSLTQAFKGPALPYMNNQNGLAQPQTGMGQSGAGVIDTIKSIHSKVRKGKYISKALHAVSHFKPGAKRFADFADQLGYGRFDQPIGINPDFKPRFSTMPVRARQMIK
jgi:hypothetical protein